MLSSRLSFVRGATLGFAYVFSAAVAALALLPFEAAAAPLVPGILLAVAMGRCAGRMTRATRRSREELSELARANLGLFALALPLAAGEVYLGWSHATVLLVTCALSVLALAHGAMTLAAFRLPPTRAVLPASYPCA